jgi:methyl-accepting chemotaxis protein
MTNMVNGKYADSGLGKLVRGVLNTKSFGIADFAPYAPSNGDPAAFIAEPVMKNGQVQVIVALQLSLDAINAIMTERDGMGESGETYLVGQDKLMRSDSYLDQTYHTVEASFANPVRGSVDTKAARQALAGRTGAEIIKDYNGNPVLSAYAPVQVGDLTWALIAEIDKSEAFQAVTAIEWLIGIIALVGVAAILVVALLITRSITRPINQTIDSLTTGAEQVTSASTQVSGASQSLAEGASEQAAALEETSSSLEEMTSMTRQNAENASQADGLMRETSKTVDRAGQSMTQMNQAMGDISEAGQEIGKIIKTIDEIAFQTNLLALNAAVEAARAGEAGAGFAVVADEVRNLAGRAAEAAKNTSELIETTITRIEQGTGLVKQVDQAFAELSEGAQKVSQLIGEIAAASNEQSQGLDQINTAVNQMDQVTQNNAASAEESASASEELNAQAECMMDNVQDLVRVVGGAAACRFDETGAMHRSGAAVRPKMIAGGNGGSKPDPNGRRRYTTDQNGPRRTQTVPADRQVSTDGDFGEF